MTPLRRLLHSGWPLRLRRMPGLFAFFYASLHFLIWLVPDQELLWQNILADIAKRPYVTVGFAAWLLLVPLALTSTRGMMRRLGRNWSRLHRLVYPIAILGVLHYLWLVKADLFDPLVCCWRGSTRCAPGCRSWHWLWPFEIFIPFFDLRHY